MNFISHLYTLQKCLSCTVRNSIEHSHHKNIQLKPPVLLDTSLLSQNAGDAIIMHYALKQLSSIMDISHSTHIPTHGKKIQCDSNLSNNMKIICGTNILSTYEERYGNIALPTHVSTYKDSVLLLAAGLAKNSKKKTFSTLSRGTWQYILNREIIHSVRDSNAEAGLRSIGINNVINTSCVTMWDLTEEKCKQIPTNKEKSVLTTITDYHFDPKYDGYMIDTLKRNYKKVYIWLQGEEDQRRLESLNISGVEYIHDGFTGLQNFINTVSNINYFGTRLHCGIYCMNNNIRSTIVSIDNRASDIAADTNIPIIYRNNLPSQMEQSINSDWATDIHIPLEKIDTWKKQFC